MILEEIECPPPALQDLEGTLSPDSAGLIISFHSNMQGTISFDRET